MCFSVGLLLCCSLRAQSPREFYAQDFFLTAEVDTLAELEPLSAGRSQIEVLLQAHAPPEPQSVPEVLSTQAPHPTVPLILYLLFFLSGLLLFFSGVAHFWFWLREQFRALRLRHQLRRLQEKYQADCVNPSFKVELRALLGLAPGSDQRQIITALPKKQLGLLRMLLRHDAKFKP